MSDRDPFAGMAIGIVVCVLVLTGFFLFFMNSGYNEAEKIKQANIARAKEQEEKAKQTSQRPIVAQPAPAPVVVAQAPPPAAPIVPAAKPALPTPPQQAQQPPKFPTTINVKLPSGTVLTETMLAVPADWHSRCFAPGVVVYVAKYPNDAVQGVFAVDDSKLHGTSATLHENGVLQSLVSYVKAARNGPLKLWNDQGHRILYVEYKMGKPHGLLCFFKENMPWLVKEYDKGAEKAEHLIVVQEDSFATLSKEETTAKFVELDDARTKLDSLFNEISETEAYVKREMFEWYRKEELRLRRERASALSASRTDLAVNRIKARNAQKSVVSDAIWRGALGRSYNAANGQFLYQNRIIPTRVYTH